MTAYRVLLLIDFSEAYSKKLLRGITQYAKDFGPWKFCRMPTHYRETIGIEGILDWAKEWGAHGVIGQFYNNVDIDKITQANKQFNPKILKKHFQNKRK